MNKVNFSITIMIHHFVTSYNNKLILFPFYWSNSYFMWCDL